MLDKLQQDEAWEGPAAMLSCIHTISMVVKEGPVLHCFGVLPPSQFQI